MRIYTGDDIVGVEVGGAVKNVLAIATGIADGLGLGLNARAALITRAAVARLEIIDCTLDPGGHRRTGDHDDGMSRVDQRGNFPGEARELPAIQLQAAGIGGQDPGAEF